MIHLNKYQHALVTQLANGPLVHAGIPSKATPLELSAINELIDERILIQLVWDKDLTLVCLSPDGYILFKDGGLRRTN